MGSGQRFGCEWCCCCYCCSCGGGDVIGRPRLSGCRVEPLKLAGAAGGESFDVAELQDAEFETAPEVFEAARAAGLERMLARRGPVVVGQAQHLAGAQVDEQVDAGVEIVDPALERGEGSGVVGVGAEPGDPALVGEFVDRLLQGVARELVEPLCRGERVEAPQEDAQQSHGRYYAPGPDGRLESIFLPTPWGSRKRFGNRALGGTGRVFGGVFRQGKTRKKSRAEIWRRRARCPSP